MENMEYGVDIINNKTSRRLDFVLRTLFDTKCSSSIILPSFFAKNTKINDKMTEYASV